MRVSTSQRRNQDAGISQSTAIPLCCPITSPAGFLNRDWIIWTAFQEAPIAWQCKLRTAKAIASSVPGDLSGVKASKCSLGSWELNVYGMLMPVSPPCPKGSSEAMPSFSLSLTGHCTTAPQDSPIQQKSSTGTFASTEMVLHGAQGASETSPEQEAHRSTHKAQVCIHVLPWRVPGEVEGELQVAQAADLGAVLHWVFG